MPRILYFFILSLSLILFSCNSAFRAQNTHVVLSKTVAEYLSTKELIVHNNSTEKLITRTATIQETDTLYQLTYNKLQGDAVILQITDDSGKMRNVAIPQMKLSAYPVLLSSTISPTLTVYALTFPGRNYHTDYILLLYNPIAAAIDAFAGRVIIRTRKHARYTVPNTYRIANLTDVTTIDTANNQLLLEIPIPVNPNPTNYLTQDYRKKCEYAFSLGSSFGSTHETSTTYLYSQTSRVNLPNKIDNGIWATAGIHFQPNSHFQWGYSFHSNINPNLSINFLLNHVGFVVPLKKGSVEIGCGLGFGTTRRIRGNSYCDSFDSYIKYPLKTNQLLEESYSFIPSIHVFAPINGHIQFIYPLKNRFEIAATFNGFKMPSYNLFEKSETVLTKDQITPNIVAYRREEFTFNNITVKSTHRLFSIGLSLRLKL